MLAVIRYNVLLPNIASWTSILCLKLQVATGKSFWGLPAAANMLSCDISNEDANKRPLRVRSDAALTISESCPNAELIIPDSCPDAEMVIPDSCPQC